MLNINSLSFEELRENFIKMIRTKNVFQDVNYRGSGISLLLDILAYNSHYIGYYTKMMLDENFVDSARLKSSMIAHAKLVGYVPKNHKSAKIEIFLRKEVPLNVDPAARKILVPRGSIFSSASKTDAGNVSKSFVTIDDHYLTLREEVTIGGDPYVVYRNEKSPVSPIVAYEGMIGEWSWLVPSTGNVSEKRFIIRRPGVDIDTIRLKVYEDENSGSYEIFTRADLSNEISKSSNVFFVTSTTDGFYEIFFGNDIFGKGVNAGQKVSASFIISSGSAGNGVGEDFGVPIKWTIPTTTGTGVADLDPDYPIPVSAGGTDEETVEDLRFNIPNHYKRQNRIVTKDDFRSILLAEYRNVDAINVWGGEEALQKEYGKVFISLKPKHSTSLSSTAKKEISDKLLGKFSTIGTDIVFVDPDFIFLDFEISVKYDPSRTDKDKSQIASLVIEAAKAYESQYLNRFQVVFSEVDFLSHLKKVDSSIITLFAKKVLRKQTKVRYDNPLETYMIFGNPLVRGSIITDTLKYANKNCKIIDENGKLYVADATTAKIVLSTPVGTVDHDNGIIKLRLPSAGIKMIGAADNTYEGLIVVYAKSANPDVESSMNNILHIGLFTKVDIHV